MSKMCPGCHSSGYVTRTWEPCDKYPAGKTETVCVECGLLCVPPMKKFVICCEVTLPSINATLPCHSLEEVTALTEDTLLEIQDRLYKQILETVPESVSRKGSKFIFRGHIPLEG